MGAKPSRRKSNGAGAPSEQKCDDPKAEVDTMPAEEAPQVDITPRDLTTQDAVSEEPEDVLSKSMEIVKPRMASVSVEDPTELVAAAPDPEAKRDSLTGFSQEVSTKIEVSIPESPADPAPIPCEPLTTEDQSIPEAPEHGAEAAVGDVEASAVENEAVSGQEVSETEELLVYMNQDDA
ncbi:hypothetical protein PGIGA_G00229810 [Pangasianodon gigas]|uniref:Uncharacterized protein n=1 Tax=Pangasianodon gigas TaxID=30993 RepID=A0ACC5WMM2_PANGG|nr:hypothetical protein [Pangasianodon gigas]